MFANRFVYSLRSSKSYDPVFSFIWFGLPGPGMRICYTLKQPPPINSLKSEFVGTGSLPIPTK